MLVEGDNKTHFILGNVEYEDSGLNNPAAAAGGSEVR